MAEALFFRHSTAPVWRGRPAVFRDSELSTGSLPAVTCAVRITPVPPAAPKRIFAPDTGTRISSGECSRALRKGGGVAANDLHERRVRHAGMERPAVHADADPADKVEASMP